MNSTLKNILGVATVVGAAIALAGCSLIGGAVKQATGTDPFNNNDPWAVKVGDCFTEPSTDVDDTVSEVPIVECSVEHDYEAYASVLVKDADFPGNDAFVDKSQDACFDRFFEYIGAETNYDGTLDFGSFYPSEESWKDGDREILCYVYDTEGRTTGSVKGIAG